MPNFDLLTMTDWKLRKLYEWQPEAKNILDGWQCPLCHCNHTVTYQIPGDPMTAQRPLLHDVKERCAFYCPGCDYGNASHRLPAQANEEYIDGLIFETT